jgi:hypothetical protein
VDTMHQGDREGTKGVYPINAVDELKQWEVVGATAQISEAWLEPVLKTMLAEFSFKILTFHSDNGSEFINHTVAKLLNKLLIEQTKSRPRHFNPHLNFHRRCGVPEQIVQAKGKVKRVYQWYATSWEILRQLPGIARHLKTDVTIQELERQARGKSDTQAAVEMREAKRKLFAGFLRRRIASLLPSGSFFDENVRKLDSEWR